MVIYVCSYDPDDGPRPFHELLHLFVVRVGVEPTLVFYDRERTNPFARQTVVPVPHAYLHNRHTFTLAVQHQHTHMPIIGFVCELCRLTICIKQLVLPVGLEPTTH